MRKEPLRITQQTHDDVTVLELDGDLALDNNLRLRETFTAALETGARKMIVNLAAVEYMDSSGLGELVACYTALQKQGGRLALMSLNDRLETLLTITKLDTVFECFDSEPAAVASFTEKSTAQASA